MTTTPPAIGTSLEVPVEFSQRDFDTFARLTGDHNPIHVDPDFSAGTRFGRTVAHGMLLFGVLGAAVARWFEAPPATIRQELMFPAPTFAGDAHVVQLSVEDGAPGWWRVGQRITTAGGEPTAVGYTVVGTAPGSVTEERAVPPPPGAVRHRGLALGRTATQRRRFEADEIEAFCALVDDPNPRWARGIVPPPLLGGMVSYLLGVELPGPGTNWLKQRYDFRQEMTVGADVDATVEVVRLRPDKDLVDLTCVLEDGDLTVATGRSLVLVRDT